MSKNSLNLEVLHSQLYDLLSVFDKFCSENNIKYFLAYGTALGAFRHNGFIPWDDDVDLGMLRKDYKKFIKLCKNKDNSPFSIYCVQTDKYCNLLWCKVSFKDTNFKDVWLDIFPYDNVIGNSYKIQKNIAKVFYYPLLFKNKANVTFNHPYLFKLLSILPRTVLCKLSCFFLEINNILFTKYASELTYDVKESTIKINKKLVKKLDRKKFGVKSYPVLRNTESLLSEFYGNWNELPPLEKRVAKHF